MSHLHLVTTTPPQLPYEEMLKDHKKILQNYFDSYTARGLSETTKVGACGFIQRWFEKIRVRDADGERQIFIWQVMNLGPGRQRIRDFLLFA